jgi:hypothetical protein
MLDLLRFREQWRTDSVSGSDFWEWFDAEMARQGFRSVRQVERAGGVGNDTINGRQRNGMPPTDTIIRAVANAFEMSFEEVEEVARGGSAVEDTGPTTLTLRELWGIVSKMPVEEQRAVLDYALYRRSRSGERGAATRSLGPGATRQSPAASDRGS